MPLGWCPVPGGIGGRCNGCGATDGFPCGGPPGPSKGTIILTQTTDPDMKENHRGRDDSHNQCTKGTFTTRVRPKSTRSQQYAVYGAARGSFTLAARWQAKISPTRRTSQRHPVGETPMQPIADDRPKTHTTTLWITLNHCDVTRSVSNHII